MSSASPLTPTSGRPLSVMDAASFSAEAARYDMLELLQTQNYLLSFDA